MRIAVDTANRASFDLARIGRQFKSRLKGDVEVVLVVEVFAMVGLALAHFANSNKVIDNFTEVTCSVDSPAVQHRLGQKAVLF